jgi:hypothetical protein
MEFMGISIGVLALTCALVLLFGVQGARKILGWGSEEAEFVLDWLVDCLWFRRRAVTFAGHRAGTVAKPT